MADQCLFCKIVSGEIPAKIVYQDDSVVGFVDIAPMAKNHLLFVHRKHSPEICHMSLQNPEQLVEVMQAIAHFALEQKIDQSGFRIVTNCGPDAGQTVFHTHFHVLYGEKLGRFGR